MPSPAPLRCHLLIGPPASGKTTLARSWRPCSPNRSPTGAWCSPPMRIRAEVFGDAAVQGPWRDIRERCWSSCGRMPWPPAVR